MKIIITRHAIVSQRCACNDARCFYGSNEKTSLGLSRAIFKQYVGSVIVAIGRAKKATKRARNGRNGAWTVTHEGLRIMQ